MLLIRKSPKRETIRLLKELGNEIWNPVFWYRTKGLDERMIRSCYNFSIRATCTKLNKFMLLQHSAQKCKIELRSSGDHGAQWAPRFPIPPAAVLAVLETAEHCFSVHSGLGDRGAHWAPRSPTPPASLLDVSSVVSSSACTTAGGIGDRWAQCATKEVFLIFLLE